METQGHQNNSSDMLTLNGKEYYLLDLRKREEGVLEIRAWDSKDNEEREFHIFSDSEAE